MSLKRNVIANYLGQGWRALMGFVFVPVYIRYLGAESYGLIGIHAVLQVWLALLDTGMRPALVRELARFTAGVRSAQEVRDLLRSIEILGIVVALSIATGISLASDWLASNWVTAETLSSDTIAQAFTIMGAVSALRLFENIYTSSIVGLERQVLENAIASTLATARAIGAIALLSWFPTVQAFFLWQGFVSIVAVLVFGYFTYRHLPTASYPARFSPDALSKVWSFAQGTLTISILATLLTQVDKVLLSRLLTLEAFSYYTLAAVVANSIFMLTGPVTTAFFPRFTDHVARSDRLALVSAYHQAAQLVSVTTGSAALVLIFFADRLLMLWTGDSDLATRTAPLLSLLAFGSLCNALMGIPYHLQLAHGWTALAMRVNAVAVVLLVPAFFLVVPKYGALGAAWIWVILNVGYLTLEVHLMHRRLLREEMWAWYGIDLALPLSCAGLVCAVCRWAMPDGFSRLTQIALLVLIAGGVLCSAALAAPMTRRRLPFLHMRALSR